MGLLNQTRTVKKLKDDLLLSINTQLKTPSPEFLPYRISLAPRTSVGGLRLTNRVNQNNAEGVFIYKANLLLSHILHNPDKLNSYSTLKWTNGTPKVILNLNETVQKLVNASTNPSQNDTLSLTNNYTEFLKYHYEDEQRAGWLNQYICN